MGLLSLAHGARYAKKTDSAPGPAVLIMTEASETVTREIELYHPPGLLSSPTKGERIIEVRIGSSGRAAVASHDYRVKVDPALEPGEALLFSTDPETQAVKASVRMKTDGGVEIKGPKASATLAEDGTVQVKGEGVVKIDGSSLELKGAGKSLVTHGELAGALASLVTALNIHVHARPGSPATTKTPPPLPPGVEPPPAPFTLDISAAKAENLRTDG